MFSAILGLTDDVNDQDFINFWSSCLGRTRSGAILKLRDVSAVDDELITIGRVNRHGEPHWRTRLVVRGPEYLENAYPAVCRQAEEPGFGGVGRPYRDPVAVADLLQAQGLLQVFHRADGDVVGLNEPVGSLEDESHGVEGRLHRPRGAVDRTLLMSADDLRTFGKLQEPGDGSGCLLDLDLGVGAKQDS